MEEKLYTVSIHTQGTINRIDEFIKAVLNKLPEATNGIGKKDNRNKNATINTMYPFYDEVTITLIENK